MHVLSSTCCRVAFVETGGHKKNQAKCCNVCCSVICSTTYLNVFLLFAYLQFIQLLPRSTKLNVCSLVMSAVIYQDAILGLSICLRASFFGDTGTLCVRSGIGLPHYKTHICARTGRRVYTAEGDLKHGITTNDTHPPTPHSTTTLSMPTTEHAIHASCVLNQKHNWEL